MVARISEAGKGLVRWRGLSIGADEPALTRPKLITALCALETKRDTNPRKKRGNIPL